MPYQQGMAEEKPAAATARLKQLFLLEIQYDIDSYYPYIHCQKAIIS